MFFRTSCVATCAAMAALAGCAAESADSTASSATPAPSQSGVTIIAHGVLGTFDLVAGRSYHVVEAFSDQGDAAALIAAREEKPAAQDRIDELSGHDDYRHFGSSGDDQSPLCRVDDQAAVDVDSSDDGGLNAQQPSAPVSCTTADGKTLYVTIWSQ